MLELLKFIGKAIYTTLPAIAANGAPLLVKKVNFLNVPIDFGKTMNGKPILGSKKTFRGLFFGIAASMFTLYIQFFIYKITNTNIGLFDYDAVNIHLMGFLIGFGVLTGDIVKSFFKRRLGYKESESFIPWDQLDCAIGGLIFVRFVWAYPFSYAVLLIFLAFFMHIIIRHIGYYLGICESKW